MTQEDKELLLKDLCARLPYGVIIKHKDEHGRSIDVRLVGYNGDWFNYYIDDLCFHLKIHEFKPYLRSMSSMTEKEKVDYNKLFTILSSKDCNFGKWLSPENDGKLIDFYNSRHLDYRGLISKDIAIEAPEGMYK